MGAAASMGQRLPRFSPRNIAPRPGNAGNRQDAKNAKGSQAGCLHYGMAKMPPTVAALRVEAASRRLSPNPQRRDAAYRRSTEDSGRMAKNRAQEMVFSVPGRDVGCRV